MPSNHGKPIRGLRIPSYWFGIVPGRPLSFWIRVRRRVKQANVRLNDINAVRAIALTEPYPIVKEIDYDNPF